MTSESGQDDTDENKVFITQRWLQPTLTLKFDEELDAEENDGGEDDVMISNDTHNDDGKVNDYQNDDEKSEDNNGNKEEDCDQDNNKHDNNKFNNGKSGNSGVGGVERDYSEEDADEFGFVKENDENDDDMKDADNDELSNSRKRPHGYDKLGCDAHGIEKRQRNAAMSVRPLIKCPFCLLTVIDLVGHLFTVHNYSKFQKSIPFHKK